MVIFQQLNQAGHTIIMITHEADIAEHAQRIIHLRDGKIVADQPGIRVAFSKDGKAFEPAEPVVTRTVTYGEDAYGFWKAMLCSAHPGGSICNYVRIEFQSEAQLSRIEVDADQAE